MLAGSQDCHQRGSNILNLSTKGILWREDELFLVIHTEGPHSPFFHIKGHSLPKEKPELLSVPNSQSVQYPSVMEVSREDDPDGWAIQWRLIRFSFELDFVSNSDYKLLDQVRRQPRQSEQFVQSDSENMLCAKNSKWIHLALADFENCGDSKRCKIEDETRFRKGVHLFIFIH